MFLYCHHEINGTFSRTYTSHPVLEEKVLVRPYGKLVSRYAYILECRLFLDLNYYYTGWSKIHACYLHLIQAGLDIGCTRCNFSVLDWNTPSIEFYKKHGAIDLNEAEGWLAFRMNHHEMKLFCST